MPKRYTDSDKWKKRFIRGLPKDYKLLWLYILDDCNHAGIWEVDFEIARVRLDTPDLDEKKAEELFEGRIKILNGGEKWFVPKFLEFQYGKELNEHNSCHKSVIEILRRNKLNDYQYFEDGLPFNPEDTF